MGEDKGPAGIVTPEQFDKLWTSIARYFKHRPLRATIYSLLVFGFFGAPLAGWLVEREKSEELNRDLHNLKIAHFTDVQELKREK